MNKTMLKPFYITLISLGLMLSAPAFAEDSALPAEARNHPKMAELLGYGTKEAYKPMYEQLDQIEGKTDGGNGGWLERIFMPGRRILEPSLLRTHPYTQDRIERLMALKPQLAVADGHRISSPALDAATVLGKPVIRSPTWHISGLWY